MPRPIAKCQVPNAKYQLPNAKCQLPRAGDKLLSGKPSGRDLFASQRMISFEFMKEYDLEERTLKFAEDCRSLVRSVEMDIPNFEDCKQLVRASGSVPANYIEAREPLGDRDLLMKLISRKEAKESWLWLRLIKTAKPQLLAEKERLKNECTELRKILSAIINKLR